jgi:ParB family chromosome partitioning protein
MKDTVVPGVDITEFEENLSLFAMMSDVHPKHLALFGFSGRSPSEDERFRLFKSLTPEQKNVIKRDFLIKNMLFSTGKSKKAALLVELARLHLPDETAKIEKAHIEDFTKKNAAIQEQIQKIAKNTEKPEIVNEAA